MDKLEIQGDNPKPRFGHTLNLISKTKAILFGGAIGDSSQYSITNDVFSLDLNSLSWKKLSPQGKKPSVRAAHASCSIDLYQVLIFGGATGGGGLSSDELFLLDLKSGEEKALWIPIEVKGKTPGPRYGHSLVFIKPNIVVFGGNSGNESLNDVWFMNLERSPYSWNYTDLNKGLEMPPARVYHAAAVCSSGAANGMMVLFGGRANDQNALNDTWGLRKHRDGKWDWVKAPHKNQDQVIPKVRYQHSICFCGTLMLVVGGRTNQTGENLALDIYDTDTSEWHSFLEIPKFRHAMVIHESDLFIYGGFEPENPNTPTNKFMYLDLSLLFEKHQNLLQTSGIAKLMINSIGKHKKGRRSTLTDHVLSDMKNSTQIQEPSKSTSPNKGIRIAPLAVIATVYGPKDNLSEIIKKIPIENLQDEAKKIGAQIPPGKHLISMTMNISEEISSYFLNILLPPKPANIKTINLNKEMIFRLCDEVQNCFQSEPTLLNIRGPIKIFGNLHGQFDDLLKIFEHFGYPEESLRGDIESNDYLFLGDYVDKGNKSIELICLLFSLKIKFPEQIHILRGHHEDRKVNYLLGFAEECAQKFCEDYKNPSSIFTRINKVFDFLPLAAVVERKLFCVHGGIGQNLKNLRQIDRIKRPIEISHESNQMTQEQILLNEMLWTDPIDTHEKNEKNRGFFGNENMRNMKFSFESVISFLETNGLAMIIRSHEFVKDGYENLGNKLITVVSCLDYGGKLKNAGGIIYVRKNSEIYPKMIIPGMNLEQKWAGLGEKKTFTTKENKIRENLSPLRN